MELFREKLPDEIDRALGDHLPAEEKVLIQVATDMAGATRFDEGWLVLTERQLLIVRDRESDKGVECLRVDDINEARSESLVGGGRLDVDTKTGRSTTVYYSNSLVPKFAEVAEGINQLSSGKHLSLATRMERSRCLRCGRMLPEKDGVCPACVRKWHTFRRLIGYIRPYRRKALMLLLIIVASTGLNLIPPMVTKYIIDDVLTPRADISLLLVPVVLLFSLGVAKWLATVSSDWLGVTVGLRASEDIRADLYRALQFLSLRSYDKRKVGAMVSRMNNDSELVEEYMTWDLPYVTSNVLMAVGIISVLFYLNWELTLFVLAPIPPIVIVGSLIWNRLEGYWRKWSTNGRD